MKIHFIAIGGSAMHNLAIALSRKGITVTGSDDEIFEPSKSRLSKQGILPENTGWNPARITSDLDAIVLGMHARADNPELARAREMGIEIFSYPEYVYRQTENKTRVVIGGSHGKTTITSMLLHVLKQVEKNTDYLVGAQLEGYDCMVKLSKDAEIAVIEGDEYLSSPIDRRPKFHLYKPHIALITGIAWDHINVFPTWENYVEQFEKFIAVIEPNGYLIYYKGDEVLAKLAHAARADIKCIGYDTHPHRIENGKTILLTPSGEYPLEVFGDHNLQNISGAAVVLRLLQLSDKDIFTALQSFSGASKRLEKVGEKGDFLFYKDFAHAPSKLKATTSALKMQYPEKELIACMELHTFSSLNKKFLPLYKGAMEKADRALVYFSPEVVAHKKLDVLSANDVKNAFGTANVEVFTDSAKLLETLRVISWKGKTLLMMSSGNFDGIDFAELNKEIIAGL
ncbi:peptidoglycan synthetase [Cryomorpha ignava]|uniref:Peptidoglycan synthetase n=1 Tax=Cryomorpha ignava TaxID=101383 RepID=A0A7K3WW73_9FLAO|nr:Mur ligase family protein [Cryomorpha ignava]NEN24855.1 peptidoglycan synthetase [Cryomorpha ignava]